MTCKHKLSSVCWQTGYCRDCSEQVLSISQVEKYSKEMKCDKECVMCSLYQGFAHLMRNRNEFV